MVWKCKLTEISSLTEADYNPRHRDPLRFDHIKKSLQVLGWLTPAFATPDLKILSGHQRIAASHALGRKVVPVFEMEPNNEKAINIQFNRATNDIERSGLTQFADPGLDQLEPLSEMPCVDSVKLIDPFEIECEFSNYAFTVSNNIYIAGARIPVVMTESGKVVNGLGRVFVYRKNKEPVPCVIIPDTHAEAAFQCLNGLSMDFDFKGKMQHELRRNSYRRARMKRHELVPGKWGFCQVNGRSVYLDHANTDGLAKMNIERLGVCFNGSKQNKQLRPVVDTFEPLPAGTFKSEGTGASVAVITWRKAL